MNNTNDKSLESWIWDAACSIRGAQEAPKFKDFILPLIFTKRLCDVFDDELNRIAHEVGSRAKAFKLVLIRKFAEGGGQSAGEFYTPGEVGEIMALIMDPEPGMTCYDPTCGSAGLLIKCELALEAKGARTALSA